MVGSQIQSSEFIPKASQPHQTHNFVAHFFTLLGSESRRISLLKHLRGSGSTPAK